MIDSKIMAPCIDLNCDLGEYEKISQGQKDAAIMAYISSCNIACGFHAGNQSVIEHTVGLALNKNVNIGAHPSFPDRKNFGRTTMHLAAHELKSIVSEQIQCIKSAAETQGGKLSHVKPHGALYNQAADDFELAVVLAEAVAEIDSGLMFYGLAHSAMELAAQQSGIQFVAEGFADRAYTNTRTLVPRNVAGAVISDVAVMLDRALQMLKQQLVTAITGETIQLRIDTLCLHGDHANAKQTAQFLRQGLQQAGFSVQAPQTNKQHV